MGGKRSSRLPDGLWSNDWTPALSAPSSDEEADVEAAGRSAAAASESGSGSESAMILAKTKYWKVEGRQTESSVALRSTRTRQRLG